MTQNVVLRPVEIAVVLGLECTRGKKRGEPSRTQAIALIRAGKLALVDPDAPPTQYSVSVAEIRRYIDRQPRMEAEAS